MKQFAESIPFQVTRHGKDQAFLYIKELLSGKISNIINILCLKYFIIIIFILHCRLLNLINKDIKKGLYLVSTSIGNLKILLLFSKFQITFLDTEFQNLRKNS